MSAFGLFWAVLGGFVANNELIPQSWRAFRSGLMVAIVTRWQHLSWAGRPFDFRECLSLFSAGDQRIISMVTPIFNFAHIFSAVTIVLRRAKPKARQLRSPSESPSFLVRARSAAATRAMSLLKSMTSM